MFQNVMRCLAALLLPCIGADSTSISAILKRVYDPMIQDQANNENFTWRDFPDGEGTVNAGGTGIFFDARMGGNQEGIGARGEKNVLPAPGNQRHAQAQVTWRYVYGSFSMSGPIMELARGGNASFAAAKTDEVSGLTSDVMKEFNWEIYGTNRGTKAIASVTATAATVTVYDAITLRLNMVVNAVTLSSGNLITNGQGRLITAIAPNADGSALITLGTATGGQSGTIAFVVNTTGLVRGSVIGNLAGGVPDPNSAYNQEVDGLSTIVDDGTVAATYLGITRATFPLWKGNVLFNPAGAGTARNLSTDVLQQGEDAVVRFTGKRPDWIRMNLGQRRKFFDVVAGDRRFNSSTFDAGYERLSFNGISITVDVDCPKGKIFMCSKSSIEKTTLRKFGLIDFDGLMMRQNVAGGLTDDWVGFVGAYCNLMCKRPNSNALITDLQEPPEVIQYVG